LEGELNFKEKTLIMGVINVSPDSFYQGSRVRGAGRAVERALLYEDLGADIIDIGGESTRPGSESISAEEEKKRVLPVLEGVRKRSGIALSVDTYKPEVAAEAVDCGAVIVNDISGLTYENGLEEVVSKAGVYIVLMHIRGVPLSMQQLTNYHDVVKEVSEEMDWSVNKAIKAGIGKERIIIDPGIGFAKTAKQNITILKNLSRFKQKGFPLLVGLSRKSFLGAHTGLEPEDRLIPTVAANAIAILLGADIIRVHDVREASETVKTVDAIKHS
jgi:dihydropteroate synthase